MTRAVIFSFIPCSKTSMVASTRIARFVSEALELPLVWDESIGEQTELDALLIVNGAYGFCKHLEPLSRAIAGAKRIVWIQNDYTIVPPINDGKAESPFRRAFVERREKGKSHLEFWTTCDEESRWTPLSYYVNWNCLSMQKPIRRQFSGDDLAYYGSYRTGRSRYFDEYFKSPVCPIIISSPSKKFSQLYTNDKIKHVGAAEDLIKWLGERGAGLYLEDRRSHRQYHSPPNRFYEMLSAGLPMLFQQEAGTTMRKSGYSPNAYTISRTTLRRAFEDRDQIAKHQAEQWVDLAMEERSRLPERVKEAWQHVRKST